MMHALCTICEYNGYLGDNTYLDGGNMRKRFARINFSSIKCYVLPCFGYQHYYSCFLPCKIPSE